MLKMLGFGKKAVTPPSRPAVAKASAPASPQPASQASSQTGLQREMVRTVLRNTLQKNGLQMNWVTCDMLPGAGAKDTTTLVVLNVAKWHDDLMAYAPALEQELLKGLSRMDATTAPAAYSFVWRFLPGCGCPHASMPQPEFWSVAARKAAAAKEEAKAELHKKFNQAHSEYDHRSSGFAPTEPGPLR